MRIYFENYQVDRQIGRIVVSADRVYEAENENDEDMSFDIPAWWIEELINQLHKRKYDGYSFVYCNVLIENVNKVSDYKKVWGLLNISKGMFDDSHYVDKYKTYWGVKTLPPIEFIDWSSNNAWFFFLPKGTPFPKELVREIVTEGKLTFTEDNPIAMLQIQKSIPNSVIIFIGGIEKCILSVVTENAEKWFMQEMVK